MIIEISQEDFATLCICALRYCHGRRTYMPSLVQEIVSSHFKDLSDRDLKVIADDKNYQAELGIWGDTCDKQGWERFYTRLEQFGVGLEYHTDTTHFGKAKGESITTNKVEDEPQTETKVEPTWVGVTYGKWDAPPKVDLPTGEITTCVSVLARQFLGYACETCKHRDEDWNSEACDGCCENHDRYEPKDEPQMDYGDFAGRLAYERGVKHAWEVAQKVFDSTVTFYEAEDVAKQIAYTPRTERTCDNCGTPRDKCVYCIEEDKMWTPKTEPQTERSE